MCSSPISLYDYSRIAPESPGDLFDGTEIDQLLILKILSLTEDEQRETRASEPATAPVNGVELRKGSRVRLTPRPGRDILDLAPAGRVAVVEALDQDPEGAIHLAVVLEDDPGRELGEARLPGTGSTSPG